MKVQGHTIIRILIVQGLVSNWKYVYTIERTTAPSEFGGPVGTFSTVGTLAAAVAPSTLPVVMDVCGNTLDAPVPIVSTSVTCGGSRTYTYTYVDCSGLEFEWVYTYTISRTAPPAEVGGPVLTGSVVECATASAAPLVLPVVKDVEGVTLSPTPASPVVGGTYEGCEGTITYSYTYKDCANLEYVWTYTYTLDHVTAPVVPADGGSTVECIASATTPVPPTVTDVCGTNVPAVLASTVDNPLTLTCEGTRTYNYTYTDCSGLISNWKYVYTIDHTIAPVVPADGGSTVECIAAAVRRLHRL